ncbi:MAG TPA: F0F1 ATP synthase subunit A [Candidatus Eisenbacteria bacterium]|nr:F0F1 ATP synthase subunit A [Candidatus Eisenbacteria bacterium]
MTPLIRNENVATNPLARAMWMSWLAALALAGLLLPRTPGVALAIVAGQSLMAINFFFLDKLVKLFTHAMAPRTGNRQIPGRFFAFATLKVFLVYGGAFALIRTQAVPFLPLVGGLSLLLLVLFLQSLMRAAGYAASPFARRAPQTAATSGNAAKLAAFFFTLALLAAPVVAHAGDTATQAAPVQLAQHDPAQPTTPANPETATQSEAAATAHGEAHGEGAAGAEHSEGGEAHLPNWIVILNDYFPDNPVVHWMHENEYLVFAWLAGLVFLVFTWFAMRKPTLVPGTLQNGIEWIVESMEDVCGGMLGKHLPKYFPFIMAIFFYILTMNLIGIIPGFKSSTSTLDVTLALALITFLYVQINGIINLGPLGYLDHLAGSPRDIVGFAMLPVMIPVHILGELVKPVSLSCRLFGNIFGEDTLIVVFVGVAALALKASLTALAVPPMAGITALFMLLQTLTAIVQALIFSLLTTVYLYMMLPHEAHAHGETEHEHA